MPISCEVCSLSVYIVLLVQCCALRVGHFPIWRLKLWGLFFPGLPSWSILALLLLLLLSMLFSLLLVGFEPEASFWRSHNYSGKWAMQYTCQEDPYHAVPPSRERPAWTLQLHASWPAADPVSREEEEEVAPTPTRCCAGLPTTACHTLQLALRHINLRFGQEPHLAVDIQLDYYLSHLYRCTYVVSIPA